ncbi:hypothetical protein [Niveispirillum cyanobacteriorum]|uniref:Uncharacterized protein n=1 Tax=Niveispirillum cyanobacteriorum TaxID=1612173 RepID=A0A2K9NFR6_9PROT|nr:hypothetical protein [Niveispirillum cyanobacteriorum]AUN31974.1 hypothetical protein C0V82_16220 [Niveispirillum cyanobacteriorum]GGE85272.1 hypothetical protein GCM10011317_48110 [Niveispirillum cyanobacteriorum]
MDIPLHIAIRRDLACAALRSGAILPSGSAVEQLDMLARWVLAVAMDAPAAAPVENVRERRRAHKGPPRPIQPGTKTEEARAYFQGLLDRGEPLQGNPVVARALGFSDPDTDAAGRRASKLLSRIASVEGWTLRHRGCSASGTFGRQIVDAQGRETPWCDQVIAPLPSAGEVPASAIQTRNDDGGLVEAGLNSAPARMPEDNHVTQQADTGHAPDVAGAPIGVAPAQGGVWPGGVVRDGPRHLDHCATLAVEIVEAGEVMPGLHGCLAWLKARYNGSWSACGDVASISGCFTMLKRLGFCTITPRPEYPILRGQPPVRQVTLWDGRTSALPPLPEPKPPARPVTENMAASNARRAEEAAIVDPAGTRRKDKLAAILLRCVEEQTPVPSNVEIGQALNMHPCNTPDVLKVLREDGWGRMEHVGKVGNMRRQFIMADGRSTPWSQGPIRKGKEVPAPKAAAPKVAPVVAAKPAPIPAAPKAITRTEPPAIAKGAINPRPNMNTGIYERRPSPAAKTPTARDVSPELRAEIERRVAAGQITRADKPGYAAPTDSTAAGIPVYSSAGTGRRPSY